MIRDAIRGRLEALSGKKGDPIGIGGFVAYSKENEARQFKAQVATQYLEDGSFASDHIINEPHIVQLNFVIGENNIKLMEIPEALKQVANIAGAVSPFLPVRSQAQLSKMKAIGLSAMDTIDKLDNFINIGKNVSNLISGNTSKSVPEQFLDFIKVVYNSKLLISLEVDFETLENMAMTDLTLTRDNQTKETKVDAIFQQVNFLKTKIDDLNKYFQKPKTGSGVGGDPKDKGGQDAKNGSLLGALLGR